MDFINSILTILLMVLGLSRVPYLLRISHQVAITWDYLHTQLLGPGKEEEFDFIIVGAGSAGAVVANRLSKHFNVLLLEGGGDPSLVSNVPYLMNYLIDSHMDYQYMTVPQKHYLGSPDKRLKWPRGKSLGGSSAINAMNYLRGNINDLDVWAKLTGDDQWSYENVLPFFKASEDYHGNYPEGKNTTHGTGGDLYVGPLGYNSPAKETFFDALREKGYPDEDLNSHQSQTGFMRPDVTTKSGSRWSTYQAFLKPILHRKTLRIYRYSQASKVHLDVYNRAFGVSYNRHGTEYFARASKEIIISCGTTDSPKLLMLSGIDKINCDSAGGENLIDHPAAAVTILLNSTISFLPGRDLKPDVFYEYSMHGTGPLSSVLQLALGFTTSKEMKDASPDTPVDWPDLYFFVFNQGISKKSGKYLEPYEEMDANRVVVALPKPNSRGKITLASNNVKDPPLIDPNYFDDPSDLPRLIEAVKFIVDFYETAEPFKKVGAHLPPTPFPGCENIPFRSDEYWECYVKYNLRTYAHSVGTCRMGPKDDSSTVVDSSLRVLNVSGLRVVDGSIMPTTVNGNTNDIMQLAL